MAFSKFASHRPKKKRARPEANLQEGIVSELFLTMPKDAFFFAVPNGGYRHPAEAENLRKQGVRAGVPDIVICHKGRALGLELKAPKGTISDSQNVTFPLLREAGMRIEVARTHDEAMTRIREMGVPLKSVESRNVTQEVEQIFREANRRRA